MISVIIVKVVTRLLIPIMTGIPMTAQYIVRNNSSASCVCIMPQMSTRLPNIVLCIPHRSSNVAVVMFRLICKRLCRNTLRDT